MPDTSKLEFWDTLVKALDAEPREPLPIQGRSGVTHEILALGVDEKKQRVILISPYPDALSSAMMQSDLQATFPDQRVLVARPIAADVGHILVLGGVDRGVSQLDALEKMLGLAHAAGHVIVENEIIGSQKGASGSLKELLEALVERKMLKQVEYDVEMDEKGRLERIKIKLAPREGVVSKALTLLRLGVTGAKMFHGGG